MSYMALYRKYRPDRLDEVVGQKPVIKTLKNAIKRGQIHHAYLFCGPRGTGKTSIARALAKAINCAEGPTPEPCGECVSCKRHQEGRALDLVEIDAASNRGIDEIRALKGTVSFSPSEGRYKVYIIDEVHMLTKEAFNAFLKTLEDPPPKVIFLLATTEPQKVLPTILSRCQRFDLRLHTQQDIVERLKEICADEGIEASPEALQAISETASGGLRDAISTLDQAVSFAEDGLTEEDIYELLGRLDRKTLLKLIERVISGEGRELFDIWRKVEEEGKDPQYILDDLITYLRRLLLIKECGVKTGLLEIPTEEKKELVELGRGLKVSALVSMLEILTAMEKEMQFSHHPFLLLELIGMRLMAARGEVLSEPDQTQTQETEREKEIQKVSEREPERKEEPKQDRESRKEPKTLPQKEKPAGKPEKPKASASENDELNWEKIQKEWDQFLQVLASKGGNRLRSLVRGTQLQNFENGELLMQAPARMHCNELEKKRDLLEEILQDFFGQKITPRFILNGEEYKIEKKGGRKEAGNNPGPGKKDNNDLAEHPVVKEALRLFDGEIIEDD